MKMTSIYYVVQVRTRSEEKFLKFANPIVQSMNIRIFWPRRSLRIRKRGKWKNIDTPIFAGYIFLEVESISNELYWNLKRLPGFFRFLKNNHNILPLPEKDARILNSLLQLGEVVKKSTITFDENNRISIIEGPLKGLEGCIVKIDRRKGRAKVRLDLYDQSHLVDLGFKALEKADKRDRDTDS
jgi:transcriptional antiterminator NusG